MWILKTERVIDFFFSIHKLSYKRRIISVEIEKNVITQKRIERYKSLPDEIRIRIDQLKNESPQKYLLQKQKRENAYPEIGSIFKIVSFDGISVNGMVINNHINGGLGKDLITVILLKHDFDSFNNMEVHVDDLLTEPLIVSIDMWKKGYANTVARFQGSIKFEYSFFDGIFYNYKDEYGNIKKADSDIVGIYGMTTLFGLSRHVQTELIINNQIIPDKT